MPVDFAELKRLSKEDRDASNILRNELGKMPHKIKGNFLAFFGRQFNPAHKWNCALKSLWSGFYIKYNDLEMMVDPGINIMDRAERLGVNLALTNTLFISHAHIDHKNDANVVVEMVAYRKEALLNILLSENSLDERVMSHYHNSLTGTNLTLLDANKEIELRGGAKLTPVMSVHSISGAYGFSLDLTRLKIGYTGDTGFSTTYKTTDGREISITEETIQKKDIAGPGAFNERFKKVFRQVDLLVFNLHDVDFRKYTKHSLYHSTVSDAVEVLTDSKIRLCVFDHFNPFGPIGPGFPQKVNEYIKQSTGKETKLVDLDGLIINLDEI